MTDQEQAERGASTVVVRKTMQQCIDELRRSEHSAGMVADWLEPLKADLERVTAERDAMREVCDLAPDALVILAGLHLGTTWELSPYVKDELARVTPLVRDALARLDATRKATADAAEEDRDVETARQMLREFEEVEG